MDDRDIFLLMLAMMAFFVNVIMLVDALCGLMFDLGFFLRGLVT